MVGRTFFILENLNINFTDKGNRSPIFQKFTVFFFFSTKVNLACLFASQVGKVPQANRQIKLKQVKQLKREMHLKQPKYLLKQVKHLKQAKLAIGFRVWSKQYFQVKINFCGN